MRLLYCGRPLPADGILSEQGIPPRAKLYLVTSLSPGEGEGPPPGDAAAPSVPHARTAADPHLGDDALHSFARRRPFLPPPDVGERSALYALHRELGWTEEAMAGGLESPGLGSLREPGSCVLSERVAARQLREVLRDATRFHARMAMGKDAALREVEAGSISDQLVPHMLCLQDEALRALSYDFDVAYGAPESRMESQASAMEFVCGEVFDDLDPSDIDPAEWQVGVRVGAWRGWACPGGCVQVGWTARNVVLETMRSGPASSGPRPQHPPPPLPRCRREPRKCRGISSAWAAVRWSWLGCGTSTRAT